MDGVLGCDYVVGIAFYVQDQSGFFASGASTELMDRIEEEISVMATHPIYQMTVDEGTD